MENRFPRLSSEHSEIKPVYDVIVIGSGYGASIASSRCARAGQKVCVLERGKEWHPGKFPETVKEASSHMQVTKEGKKDVIGEFCLICPGGGWAGGRYLPCLHTGVWVPCCLKFDLKAIFFGSEICNMSFLFLG